MHRRVRQTILLGSALVFVAATSQFTPLLAQPQQAQRPAPATLGSVTTPKAHFGHDIGADYVLPNYTQFEAYWRKIEKESPRLKLTEIGKTAEGRPQLMMIITSPDNHRRNAERTSTAELIRRYNPDHKVVFVGDASMGPYEITHAGGSVEYWNEEPGTAWFQRMKDRFRKLVWINPNPPERWRYMQSTELIRELVEDRMYPLTPDGLNQAMRWLVK